MYLKKGYVLGNRYEIIEKIGAGGMSIVYKAYCTHLKRTVAIKVLREEFIEDEEFINKFTNEATLVANLSHPNIVNIYDVGRDGDFYYIVMEYLEGKDLENIVHKLGKIDQNSALTILYSIGEALSYAHKNGIIHRDLKSKNIILTDEGIVKVADFGIATATTTSTLSVAINAIGSVHYFSPEQAKGELVDQRSDIYSLGIIAYELFTGKLPFDGDTPVQVALKHVTDEMPKPSYIADVNSSVDFLVLKATAKDPLDRYQTIEDMLNDIDQILDNNDITIDRMAGNEIAKDDVKNFSKILEIENEEKSKFKKNESLKAQTEIKTAALDKMEKVNDTYEEDNDKVIKFNELVEKEDKVISKKDQERKAKFNKLLVKLGIVNEDDEDDIEPGIAEHITVDDEKEEDVKFDKKYKEYDKDVISDDSVLETKTKKYISLDNVSEDDLKSTYAKQENMTKTSLAASKFFSAFDDDEEFEEEKKPKKKFSFFDFITVEVEDDEDEKPKKEKKVKKKKEKDLDLYDFGKDDEMSGGYIPKNEDKNIVRAAVFTSLIIIGFLLFGMIKYIMYLNDNRLIEVPNFVGQVYEDIKKAATESGYNLEVVDEEATNSYDKGTIIRQSVNEGDKIPRHTPIEIVLSKGHITGVMPDLQARSVDEAISALEKYNVHITTSSIADNTIQEGYIVSTSPSYGSTIEEGINVVLYISEGGQTMYIMPNLVGMTLDEAKEAMEEKGLVLGNVTYKSGDETNAIVETQNVAVGTSMFIGQKANVTMVQGEAKPQTKTDKEDNEDDKDDNAIEYDTANVKIESKQGMLLDDEQYVVEIIVEEPSSPNKPRTIYRELAKGSDINKTFKKAFRLELGSTISVYIDDVLQKEIPFN